MAAPKFFKDLVYNRTNQNLDISRFCSLIANIAYWIVVGYGIYASGEAPDLANLGAGWAAIAAGSAAWIYARQTKEKDA